MESKLFMVLLGANPPGRITEQHDFFFGIGTSLKDLIPQMQAFWPEAGNSLHIDGWREVTCVDGYAIRVIAKTEKPSVSNKRLFFINLGGYQSGKLEEQHYTLLTVQDDRKGAIRASTTTTFFREAGIKAIKSASTHIDEKYGIDVDDIYRIEDVLSPANKSSYTIEILPDANTEEDIIQLGYYKLHQL